MKNRKLKMVLTEQNTKIENLEKQLKSKTEESDRWYRSYQDNGQIINDLHAMFDAIDGCPRTVESCDSFGGNTTLTLPSRFAAFLQTLITKVNP